MKLSESDIIFEDNHLIVVNKKSGQLVQGDRTGDPNLVDMLKAFLKAKYDKPGNVFVGCVHRLDRPVTGVCLFTKTSKALSRMNRLFAEKKVSKMYLAITLKKDIETSGKLEHWLMKDTRKNISRVVMKSVKSSKHAILNYQILYRADKRMLIQVNPVTGRPHQIRVQLASLGIPIVGDLKYGFKYPNPDASISLHCRSISFEHPVRKELIHFQAPVPDLAVWKEFASYS